MPENFQLGLLPERRIHWRTIVTSYGLEVIFILCLACVGLIWPPERLNLRQRFTVTEVIPPPDLAPKPIAIAPKPQPKIAKLLPPPPVFDAPKLVVPRDVHVAPKPEIVEAPKVVVNTFQPAVLPSSGPRMARVVYTGSFGSSAVPTVNAPVQQVQTGGFGDPNGVKGEGKPRAAAVVASLGSFDLPQGAGVGNGTGGGKGIKGTVASAGFGNGIAQPAQGDGRSNGRGVQTGGFAAQEVAQSTKPRVAADNGPPTNPVEITFKPKPVYTEEARNLKLEGEVLLEVMFGSSGQLQVTRVVRGLGHGLDEAAVKAANQMRFRPAQRNGIPVDSSAVVHVMFQLAY